MRDGKSIVPGQAIPGRWVVRGDVSPRCAAAPPADAGNPALTPTPVGDQAAKPPPPAGNRSAEPLSPVGNRAAGRAGELAAELIGVHGILADVHELRSGRAVVSVHHGLLAYTDGETFWWTGPERGHCGGLLPCSATEPGPAAGRLAEHRAFLRARPATGVLESGLPLLADAILADHVVPR
ncbi:hypothetical protein [Streptosporangium sp. NPDC002524]|uniref:hypothetical protein n=1 Tax=Streptosporangium sp. NPDC002524 TaxID=3154537 RepID=UPI00332141DC